MKIPKRIYLSGGGIAAMAHVGALQELQQHIPLQAVKEWMGVSAGALVSMCLCAGFTLDELADFSVRFNFEEIKEPDSIPGWILYGGMDTGERLYRLITACLRVKGLSPTITFQELAQHAHGKTLRVLATDVNLGKGVCYHSTTTPDYPVADAVCSSMTYPYFFQPFVCSRTGHSMVDGGVTSNYPLYLIPKEEYSVTLSLLIRLSMKAMDDLEELPIEQRVIRPLMIALTEKTNIEVSMYPVECIKIPLDQLNILDFSLGEETKRDMVEKGREAVRHYMEQHPVLIRRNSI